MKNLPAHLAAFALGVPMIIFGLNKFLLFANVAPPEDKTAQMFLGAMFTSYLAKLVGLTEIIGGGLVLSPRFRSLGWHVLSPVIVNIAVFHFVHDMPGNMIWLVSVFACIVVMIFQAKSLKRMLEGDLT